MLWIVNMPAISAIALYTRLRSAKKWLDLGLWVAAADIWKSIDKYSLRKQKGERGEGCVKLQQFQNPIEDTLLQAHLIIIIIEICDNK